MGKLFNTRVAVTNFKLLRAMQNVVMAFSKLNCHAMKMQYVLKSFEDIIYHQYGNALNVYDAFIRYQAMRKRELRESYCYLSSWQATQKHSRRGGCIWPSPTLEGSSFAHNDNVNN